MSRWRHTSCQESLGFGSDFRMVLTDFPCKGGNSAAFKHDEKKQNTNIKENDYLCNTSSVVLHGAFASLTKGKRSFESLISFSKTRNGSACSGDNGFATGAETSAVFLIVHRF